MTTRIRDGLYLAATGIVFSIAFAPQASAQTSALRTYAGQGGDTATLVSQGAGGGSADPTSAAGGLPFTGMDLIVAFAGGVALIMVGLVLSRLVGARDAAT